MRKSFVIALVLLTVFTFAAFAQNAGRGRALAPGQADNFYRGITTVGSTSVTETIVEEQLISSETETRTIGGGQFNSGKDGNLQDRSVETVSVTVTEVTTTTVQAHRGAPVSRGKDLSWTEVSSNVVSQSEETRIGDWGSAYDVPSETK